MNWLPSSPKGLVVPSCKMKFPLRLALACIIVLALWIPAVQVAEDLKSLESKVDLIFCAFENTMKQLVDKRGSSRLFNNDIIGLIKVISSFHLGYEQCLEKQKFDNNDQGIWIRKLLTGIVQSASGK